MIYEKWIKKALDEARKANKKYNLHSDNFGLGEKESFYAYLQYQLINKTWWLVIATWILAIATIILVIITK